jgi:GDP-4-dehydro-6-deoxy-D-mannose reductase
MIFHMAAQSFVTVAWKEPLRTLETNIIGTFNLLEAVRKAGINPVIIIACSSAEYGLNYEDEIPINEKKEFRPSSHYAVSKIGTDMLAYLYFQAYNMRLFRIRFFNTTGPRKTMDACSDFSKGVAEVEAGISNQLSVGNLNAVRDFTDVRDSINALWLIKDKGKYGDVYNICSNKRYKVKDFIDILLKLAKKKVTVKQDPAKQRILDDPIFVGDNTKVKSLGWSPRIPIEKTLEDMLNYWRSRLGK